MADFAPNSTGRVRIRYTVQGGAHTALFRCPDGGIGDITDLKTKIQGWLDALASVRYTDWLLIGVEYAAINSDLFLNTALFPVAAGQVAVGSRSIAQKPWFVQFIGKSGAGGRASHYLYGTNLNETTSQGSDYRIAGTELAVIQNALDALVAPLPRIQASDGGTVTYYPYVNVKASDHWVHKVRTG